MNEDDMKKLKEKLEGMNGNSDILKKILADLVGSTALPLFKLLKLTYDFDKKENTNLNMFKSILVSVMTSIYVNCCNDVNESINVENEIHKDVVVFLSDIDKKINK